MADHRARARALGETMTTDSGATRRFFGLILIVAGVLWLVSTGLCTLMFLDFVVSAYGLASSDMQSILIVAGPSLLIGWGLYALGRRLRPKRP
jgi:hypothetical protein